MNTKSSDAARYSGVRSGMADDEEGDHAEPTRFVRVSRRPPPRYTGR